MLSVRSFAHSATTKASRHLHLTPVLPSFIAIRPANRLPSAWKSIPTQFAPFSTSNVQRAKAKDSDAEIVAKIQSELELEKEMNDGPQSTTIKDFLKNSSFDIVDTPGEEEVILKRNNGDEKIQISFSIQDLNMDPEFNDRAFDDEESEENSEEPKNTDEDMDEDENGIPVRLNIIVEKPSKGAIAIEAVIQDGCVITENIYSFKDASVAYAKTPEKVQQRQTLYLGPPFSNLDENLQVLFERYLDERGINTALAIFVPEYIQMKEQKEYVRWLENVKKFIDS